jgi:hypothetical protein
MFTRMMTVSGGNLLGVWFGVAVTLTSASKPLVGWLTQEPGPPRNGRIASGKAVAELVQVVSESHTIWNTGTGESGTFSGTCCDVSG